MLTCYTLCCVLLWDTEEYSPHHSRLLSWHSLLWPCDDIWRHRTWSTMVQVMACCLTATSHYLNLCWLPISDFLWHSPHDDVIKWKHFPRNWPFVRGIHRSPVNSSHKGQWRGALMFSLICVWINDWVNNREAGALRRYRAHYDVIVMWEEFYSEWPSYYSV